MRRSLREDREIDIDDVTEYHLNLVRIKLMVNQIRNILLFDTPKQFKKDFSRIADLKSLDKNMEDFRDEIMDIEKKIKNYTGRSMPNIRGNRR